MFVQHLHSHQQPRFSVTPPLSASIGKSGHSGKVEEDHGGEVWLVKSFCASLTKSILFGLPSKKKTIQVYHNSIVLLNIRYLWVGCFLGGHSSRKIASFNNKFEWKLKTAIWKPNEKRNNSRNMRNWLRDFDARKRLDPSTSQINSAVLLITNFCLWWPLHSLFKWL